MKYEFNITIRPTVNFQTKAAELYVANDDYNGSGKGIVVHNKHIMTCPTAEVAREEAEKFCLALREKLEAYVTNILSSLNDAEP